MTDAAPHPPRLENVLVALRALCHDADLALIERHALNITGKFLSLLASKQARGYDIGSDSGKPFARPRVTKPLGLRRELEELLPKARRARHGKIGPEEWATIWGAQPARIKAIWMPAFFEYLGIDPDCTHVLHKCRSIDRRTVSLGFDAPGYSMISPKPEIVLPMLEAELSAMKAAPKSKERCGDSDEDDALDAVCDAYSAITGHKGGRVISRLGKLDGRLFELGREIDRTFGTDLFKGDGRRFRRLSARRR
ncbi:hypothetical protein ACQR16_24530 [Bradyrhizobium oligotrophicum]|uniref:hypothetical protein n=1 Tax=Bradyrhizobium oligotrophicum TaxID=44255 RepID=UPI003EBF1F6F